MLLHMGISPAADNQAKRGRARTNEQAPIAPRALRDRRSKYEVPPQSRWRAESNIPTLAIGSQAAAALRGVCEPSPRPFGAR